MKVKSSQCSQAVVDVIYSFVPADGKETVWEMMSYEWKIYGK